MLEAAGAASAKVLIIALDDQEKVNTLIETARKHFPKLRIMARAVSRAHEFELVENKIDYSIHQNVGSSIQLGEAALRALGYRSYLAHRVAKKFQAHDGDIARSLAEIHRDEKVFISRVRERIADMEQQFEIDQERADPVIDSAWDTEQIRRDTD